MSAIDFPDSPSLNQVHTVGDRSWKWNGSVWAVVRATDLLVGPTGATGPTGNTGPTGSAGSSSAVNYVYIASAGQTTFSGADSNSLSLAYTVGAEQVYVNGVLQVRGTDYTASNGTSVVLTTAAIASDIVTVVAYGTFTVADAYTQSAANAAFQLNSNGFLAGKNKIINGDFSINQRNVTSTTTNDAFIFDRWSMVGVGGTTTTTSESFTLGSAPVTGYEGNKYIKQAITGQTTQSQYSAIRQKIEDVRTFANQTVTLSFWAKADSGTPYLWVEYQQNFGTGGSPSATPVAQLGSTITLSTSWTRYSVTGTIASISGKTIGTNNDSALQILLWTSLGSSIRAYTGATYQNTNISVWGVQVEAGSVATAFQTATGTIQGELAACQRYYQVFNRDNMITTGAAITTAAAIAGMQFFQEMRTAPTITVATAGSGSGQMTFLKSNGDIPATIGSIAAQNITKYGFRMDGTGFTSAFTAGNAALLWANSADVWKASAEL